MITTINTHLSRGQSRGDLMGAAQQGDQEPHVAATLQDNQNLVRAANTKKRANANAGMVTGDRSWRQKIWITCEYPSDSRIAKMWSLLVMATILMSSASFVTLSLPEFYQNPPVAFDIMERISVAIFTIEFCSRLLTCPSAVAPGESETVWVYLKTRFLFCKKVMNLVDLLAILPFYIEEIVALANPNGGASGASSLAVVRIIRIARVFRLLKLGKHNEGLEILVLTMQASWSFLVSVLFLIIILQVLFGSLIFYAETGSLCVQSFSCFGGSDHGRECTLLLFSNETDGTTYSLAWSSSSFGSKTTSGQPPVENGRIAQPMLPVSASGDPSQCGIDSDCNSVGNICFMEDGTVTLFNSIPITMWWALVTMCCVGYGDLRPTTALGQLVGALTAITGVIVLAMPTTVIGTNFSDIYETYYDEKDTAADADAQAKKMLGAASGAAVHPAPSLGGSKKGFAFADIAALLVRGTQGQGLSMTHEAPRGTLEGSELNDPTDRSFKDEIKKEGGDPASLLLSQALSKGKRRDAQILGLIESWSNDLLRDEDAWAGLRSRAKLAGMIQIPDKVRALRVEAGM